MSQLWSQEQSRETGVGVGVGPGCEDRGKKGLAGVQLIMGSSPLQISQHKQGSVIIDQNRQ